MQNVTFIELCIGYKASVVELFRSQRAVYINLLSFFLFFFFFEILLITSTTHWTFKTLDAAMIYFTH